MPGPTLELRVLVNPYAAIDHLGRPCGALLKDAKEHRPYTDPESDHGPRNPDPRRRDPSKRRWEVREFVGATRTSKPKPGVKARKERVGKRWHTFPVPHDHTWTFTKDVVTVPNTMLYQRSLLQDGVLFAADIESWEGAGGDPQLFVDPKLKLAWAKEGAIALFIAHHGENDARLEALAMHWADHVEQRHPVGQKFEAAAKARAAKTAAEAKAKAPAPTEPPAAAAPSPAPAPTAPASANSRTTNSPAAAPAVPSATATKGGN